MASFFPLNRSSIPRKGTITVLAFVFLLGLILGGFCALRADASNGILVREALSIQASVIPLLFVLLLPFLLSVIVFYANQPRLLIPIVFGKGFVFAYVSICVRNVYPDSGWLLQFLLMFTDCVNLPILWWYWLQGLDAGSTGRTRPAVTAVTILSAVGLLDVFYVSPFLVNLIR